MRIRSLFTGLCIAFLSLGTNATLPALAGEADQKFIDLTVPSQNQTIKSDNLSFAGRLVTKSVPVNVVIAIDLSLSTIQNDTKLDCTQDGKVDENDNLNGDQFIGSILDCEIHAAVQLNTLLKGIPNSNTMIRVGLVPFAGSASHYEFQTEDGVSPLIAPGYITPTSDDQSIDEITKALSTLTANKIGNKELVWGTDYTLAIRESLDNILSKSAGDSWIFFLSDGNENAHLGDYRKDIEKFTQERDLKIRTFAVGVPSNSTTKYVNCTKGVGLDTLAKLTNEKCVEVNNAATLSTDIVNSTPSEIQEITLYLGSASVKANIDPIGNWSAKFPEKSVSDGRHRLKAVATYKDGRNTETSWDITVKDKGSNANTRKQKFRYVALGDSFSAGEGIPEYKGRSPHGSLGNTQHSYDRYVIPSAIYVPYPRAYDFSNTVDADISWLCHQSKNGWPEQIAQKYGWNSESGNVDNDARIEFVNSTCSGAVSTNVLSFPQVKKWHSNKLVKNNPPQIDSLTQDTDLVTFTIGGNDVGFGPIVSKCTFDKDCRLLPFPTGSKAHTLEDWAKIRLALMHSVLDKTYSSIRSHSPQAKIIAGTYPKLYGDDHGGCPIGTPTDIVRPNIPTRRWMDNQVSVFNAIINKQAQRSDLLVADISPAFEGHAVCAADNERWLHNVELRTNDDLTLDQISAASYHPNSKGAAAYAAAFNEVISKNTTRNISTTPSSPHTSTFSAPTEDNSLSVLEYPAEYADVVENPQAVLGRYPASVVREVQHTTFVQLQEFAKKHPTNYEGKQCDAVVNNEIVPMRANGFAPNSDVTITLTDGSQEQPTKLTEYKIKANEFGVLDTEITVPDNASGNLLLVEFSGRNTNQGIHYGNHLLALTASETCRAQADAAGALVSSPKNDSAPNNNSPTDSADTQKSETKTGIPSSASNELVKTEDISNKTSRSTRHILGLPATGANISIIAVSAFALSGIGIVLLRRKTNEA